MDELDLFLGERDLDRDLDLSSSRSARLIVFNSAIFNYFGREPRLSHPEQSPEVEKQKGKRKLIFL